MRWLEKIRMQLEMVFHRGREVRRLDAEISFHLEQQIAENIAARHLGQGIGPGRLSAWRFPERIQRWTWESALITSAQ